MPPPPSEPKPVTRRGASAALIAGLAAIIFVAAATNGHGFNAVAGAIGFYLFGDRSLAWFVASKTGANEDDQPSGDVAPELAEPLAKLEATRVVMAAEIERRIRTRMPLGLGCGVGAWAWFQQQANAPGLIALALLSVMGSGIGWAWAAGALTDRYRHLYKQEVLPRLAASFGPLSYRTARDVDVGALKRQRLFGDFDHARFEDEIVGDYHGVPISIVELRLDRDQNNSSELIFDGLLASVTLPRGLTGTTAILAEGGAFGALRDLFHDGGQRVRLEDPDFERQFQVFGTDQISARALLTPAFMDRFLGLGQRTGFRQPVALAENNRLTIALPKTDRADLFEPPAYDRPAASRAALARLHADIAAVLAVADAVIDLDQSVRARAAPVAAATGSE